MESSLVESVQQMVRPGKCVDLYYPDPETAKKECFRTINNTRYVQAFTNLSSGMSQFIIPPNNGLQDIICVFELPALSSGNADGLGLNRGWCYSLIKQVSFRYGGSSQYFLSGQQLLQNALRQAPNGNSRDDLLALGGNACNNVDLQTAQRGYVWLSLPHCVPSSSGKLPPLPTDLLTQQVIIQVELFPVSSIFSVALGSTGVVPTALSFAEFQAQQVIFENQGDALARRVDMSSHALSYPINFVQQEVIIPLGVKTGGDSITLSLTGFRSGELKNIQTWITDDADTTGNVKNPFNWYALEDVTMLYAGEVYARFDKGSSTLWNLVNNRLSPLVQDVLLTDVAGQIVTTTPKTDNWVELPFAQTFDALTDHSMYVSGKNILNGIVNLSFKLPASLGSSSYTLHCSYVYNGVLTFSQGSCDYIL